MLMIYDIINLLLMNGRVELRMKRFIFFITLCFNLHAFAMAPKVSWENAIDKAVSKYGLRVEPQLKSYFNKAGVQYPPKDVALLAFKAERKVELWARNPDQKWTHVHNYPLTGYSGRLGPKLKVNDKQIPEGIYRLVNFNPFSSMHLSMMINYPNQFDRQKGHVDGRRDLGNNIFIHGKNLSVGCLAVGDLAIDQLFILARRVGLEHIKIIIAPNDLRKAKPATPKFAQPKWLPELYEQLIISLKPFKAHKAIAKI